MFTRTLFTRPSSTASAALALTFALAACAGSDEAASGDLDSAAVPAAAAAPAMTDSATEMGATVRVADIVADPTRYAGQTVTVVADVEEVLTPYAFQLDEDSPTAGGIDNDLTVFSPKSAQLADIDDQWLNNKVRVTGTVRAYSVVDIERDIGWDLDPQVEAELEGVKAALVASSVERVGDSQ